MEKRERRPATDGGWGWMVVLGTAIAHIIFGIIVRSFGVTYLQLLSKYNSSETVTSWVGAISMTAVSLFGPLASSLCQYFSCRSVTLAGAIIMATGVTATAFAPNIYVCYVTFGFIGGLGQALSMTPGYIMVQSYFDKKKSLAMALSTFGTGLGALVFPPLLLIFFQEYGFSGAFIILGALGLHCFISAALFRPLEVSKEDKACTEKAEVYTKEDNGLLQTMDLHDNQPSKNTSKLLKWMKCNSTTNSAKKKPKIFDITLIKDLKFLCLCLVLFSVAFTLALESGYLPALAIQAGISTKDAVFLMSVGGVSSIVSTLVVGYLLDLPFLRTRRLLFCNTCNVVVGVSTILNGLATEYWMFVVLTVFRSLAAGVIMSQRMTLTSDTVGRERAVNAFGLLLFNYSIGCLIGRTIGGSLKDIVGSYSLSFYISGGTNLISALIFYIVLMKHYRSQHKQERSPNIA